MHKVQSKTAMPLCPAAQGLYRKSPAWEVNAANAPLPSLRAEYNDGSISLYGGRVVKGSKKAKRSSWQQFIPMFLFLVTGIVCGLVMVRYIEDIVAQQMPFWEEIIFIAVLFVLMLIALLIQIVIHEGGHLVFGRISGYRFSSFRIMNLMWIEDQGKIKLKHLQVAGTGGQCLMSPPDLIDGKIPVVLYNLGGSLMNIISAAIFALLYAVFYNTTFFSAEMILLAVIGVGFAVVNGVPMRMGMVDNDGHNALALSKDKEALQSFWIQMKISEQTTKGVRLKNMPKAWFQVPSDQAMKNTMTAAVGVFACNRLMDEHRFDEADRLMDHLLEIDSGIAGLHRNLLICDRIYVELIGSCRKEILDGMLTKEQKAFMKSMKNFPSVIRTQYAWTLLCERAENKAGKILVQFEKCAKTYPYPNDIESEWELMTIARQKAKAEE